MNFDNSLYLDNSDNAVRLRRHENNLMIIGMGIMIFGMWDIAKTMGILFLNKRIFIDAISENMNGVENVDGVFSDGFVFTIFAGLVISILLVSIAARLIIGISAVSVARKKKKRFFYIPVAVLYIISSIITVYLIIKSVVDTLSGTDIIVLETRDSPIVSVVIEITNIIMMIEVVVSSIKIRKLRKGGEDKDAA